MQVGGQAMRDSGLPDFDQGAGAAGCHTPHSIKYCLPATIKRLKGLLVAFEAQNKRDCRPLTNSCTACTVMAPK